MKKIVRHRLFWPVVALLTAALDNPHVTHVEIAEALAAYGVHVTGPSLGRHRNGRCRCERA